MDITKLRHEKDVLKDGFGKWNYSGSHPVPFHVTHHEDGRIAVERCAPGATGADVVHLRRLHATHPSNSSFKRMIAFVTGMYHDCVCIEWGTLGTPSGQRLLSACQWQELDSSDAEVVVTEFFACGNYPNTH